MENLIINLFFTAFMFALALWDYLSYGKQKHRDFKSIIMSAGVLGTFVGIFVGLQDFDVGNVENSVPSLLAGLKTAFYTSILGMALAILLSILQKSKAVKSDFENMLDYFSLQAGKLDKLESLSKLQEIVTQNQAQIESQNTYYKQQTHNFKVLEDNFIKTNIALKEAMYHLAQGASKELITALEGVIKDFNQRITDQFGDNFKELNSAVSQMILWQSNYKDSIIGLDSSLKNSLKLFESTKESLEVVAKRNTEVLEVYNALAHSIEASRIENEKLSSLLQGFEKMHENASKALGSVENLSQNLQHTHAQALEFTKESLEKVQNFLTKSTQLHQENTQEILESSFKAIEEDTQKQSEQLNALQSAFDAFNRSYLEQNKEHLEEALEFLKSKAQEFMESLMESDSALKHKNLEMIAQIENSVKERVESVKESFEESLDTLENAQKESLLLIEEQTKRSDEALLRHSQEMGSTLEKASQNLQELGEQTQKSLVKNSDTLEQHIANAVLNFDKLLGNTTKTLEENFKDSKETLTLLSKEIESSMLTTTKSLDSLLNDTANTLSQSTQNIEESLVHTNQTLMDSFKKSTKSIQEGFQVFNENLRDNLTKTTDTIGTSVTTLLEQNQIHSQNLQDLMAKNMNEFNQSLIAMQQESQNHNVEIQNQIRSSFGESYKNALESLSAFLKNTTSAYQTQLTTMAQNTHKTSLETQEKLEQDLQMRLRAIAQGFESNAHKVLENSENLANNLLKISNTQLQSHTKEIMISFNTLDKSIKTTLVEMAKNYLANLEVLTRQSIETPKNASVELLNEFNKLQNNLSDALAKTYLSLENNRKEIDTILKIIQANISTSLNQTSSLNENLCKSLGDLDGALSNITLGFRQDYEWFLRRIRELMGARG
ncbi:hypothetical protein [uncultured Helicobacter sp.]|uniref:hypothetical protein n=1 Tax=uncultured Helicobacter sp. TaxID=175537 RepID=UPI00260CCF7F|nr:hypothetical protein [uncultured Helicobacter sp.]